MKILLVEDEEALNESICHYLQQENYDADCVLNRFDAEDKLVEFIYDLIVLDINLPDGNGLELLSWIKKRNLDCGILIISARDSLDDRITGLDTGADDYLTKPFHLSELNARIKAIIRRRKFKGQSTLVHNELELIPDDCILKVGEEILDLTPKQYKIMEFFISNKNRVISKEMLATYIWKDSVIDHHNLDFVYNHVMNLRKMIKKAGGTDYVKTVYGMGYKFVDG